MNLLTLAQEAGSDDAYRKLIDSAARTPLSQVVAIAVILSLFRLAIAPYLLKTPRHLRFGLYRLFQVINEILDAAVYAGIFVFMIVRPFAIQTFLIPSGSMWPTLYVNDFIVGNKAIYRYTDPKVDDIVIFQPPKEATYGHPDQIDKDGSVNVSLIKRCQGVPGDVVELRQGVLYRNGKTAPDPNRHYSLTTDQKTFSEMPADEVSKMPMASFKLIKWHGKLIPLNYASHVENGRVVYTANATVSEVEDGTIVYQVNPEFVIPDPKDQARAIAQPAEPLPKGQYLMMGDNRNDSFDGRAWGTVPREWIIGRSEFIWLPLSRIRTTK